MKKHCILLSLALALVACGPAKDVEVGPYTVSVIGKNVTRFAIFINEKTSFSFSTRDNKKTLRAVRDHIGEDKMFRSPSFLQVVGRGLKSIPSAIAGLFSRK